MPEVESVARVANIPDPLIARSGSSDPANFPGSVPERDADDGVAPAAATPGKPQYICARRLDQVQSAWNLVYRRYVDKGLIDENPFRVHTAPQAVGQHACVIYGPSEETFGFTLTMIGDNADGIPLDSVYGERLNALRRQGRSLVEVGLLADRRSSFQRGARELFDMMRWAAYYTLHTHATDIVIGVHPHHERFYMHCFGFGRFAPPTLYPLVKDNPVVPLRLPLREALAETSLPRGLAYVRNNSIPASEFSQRFMFEPEQLRGSIIESFLETRYAVTLQPDTPSPTESSAVPSLLENLLPALPG